MADQYGAGFDFLEQGGRAPKMGMGGLHFEHESRLASGLMSPAEYDQGGFGAGGQPGEPNPCRGGKAGAWGGMMRRGRRARIQVEDHEGKTIGFEQMLGTAQGLALVLASFPAFFRVGVGHPNPENALEIDPGHLGGSGVEGIGTIHQGDEFLVVGRGMGQEGEQERGAPGRGRTRDFADLPAPKAPSQELVDGIQSTRIKERTPTEFSLDPKPAKSFSRYQIWPEVPEK
jgi:hypothetical protein